ncbi:MAG: sigma-70 family RNA polymerase sigma factor [Bacteroidota bacterium]|nr:sigma-70 family RNA polymerase sigma factor [Bacteroidota bacterium]
MNNTQTKIIVHQDLLNRCRWGDQQAQTEIYNLYYKAMYNTSLYITKNEAEAEDIMQEAFLKAFKLLQSVKVESGFGGWLKKIVINKSLDAVRKQKYHFDHVDEIKDNTVDSGTFEETGESISDKIAKIKRAMSQLPEKYRVVLSMNLLEGFDHDEISSILGITASTSRAQLSRGKQKLLQLLN